MTLSETIADDIMDNYTSLQFTAQDFYKHLDGTHQNAIIQVLSAWERKGWLRFVGNKPRSKGSSNIIRIYELVKDAQIEVKAKKIYAPTPRELNFKQCADRLNEAMRGWT